MNSIFQTNKGVLVTIENQNFLVSNQSKAEEIMDAYKYDELELSEIIKKFNLIKK